MRIVVLLLLCSVAVSQQTWTSSGSSTTKLALQTEQLPERKTPEPLSNAEKVKLAEARRKLEKAQAEFDAVQTEIKDAHGASNRTCAVSVTVVTIWGDYALVDTHNAPGCITVNEEQGKVKP